MTGRPQHSPYRAPPKIYGAAVQDTIPDNETAKIDEKESRLSNKLVEDNTLLSGLSSIASEQAIATETTEKKV